MFLQYFQRAQQGSGMPVVATSMVETGIDGSVGFTGLIRQRQRIDMGTQQNGLACSFSAAQGGQDSRLSDIDVGYADFFDFLLDALDRFEFLQARLRMTVEMAAQGDDVVVDIGNFLVNLLLVDCHG